MALCVFLREALMAVIRPESDSNHPIVGKHFVGVCTCAEGSHVFWCDSYELGRGFWMTRCNSIEAPSEDSDGECRRCVPETAIGKTFHIVHATPRRAPQRTPFRTVHWEEFAIPRAT